MSKGWEAARLDELEQLPVDDGELVWRPVRRRFGITAFGTNAYTGDTGQRVVEEHTEERYGHEELYVVLRGRATFTLDGEEIDAPAGTFVFVRPETRRGAIAAEDGTAVLGIGGKPGAHEISGWEAMFAAFSYARSGRVEEGRRELEAVLQQEPDDWGRQYNAACFEALWGDRERAIALYRRAEELNPEDVRRIAPGDADLDSIRSAIAGEPEPGGADA